MKLSSNPRDGSGRTWQRTRGIQTRARAFKTFRKTFLCQHISRFTATFRQDWDKLSMFVGGFIQTLYTGTILHPFHSQFCFQTTDMNAFLCVFICTIHHTPFNTPSFTTTWRTEDDLRQCLKKSRLRRKQCLGRRQVSRVQHCAAQSWPQPPQRRHINTSFSPPTTTTTGLSLVLWCVLGRDTQPGPQRVLSLDSVVFHYMIPVQMSSLNGSLGGSLGPRLRQLVQKESAMWLHTGAAVTLIYHERFKRRSIRRFVITEKAPTRAFSWLKAATTAFTFMTLLRHYAKQTLTPRYK